MDIDSEVKEVKLMSKNSLNKNYNGYSFISFLGIFMLVPKEKYLQCIGNPCLTKLKCEFLLESVSDQKPLLITRHSSER